MKEEAGNRMAEAVRRACVDAAIHAYEDAGISGLCAEGRWEVAVAAMRGLDLTEIIRQSGDREDLPREAPEGRGAPQ